MELPKNREGIRFAISSIEFFGMLKKSCTTKSALERSYRTKSLRRSRRHPSLSASVPSGVVPEVAYPQLQVLLLCTWYLAQLWVGGDFRSFETES
ncbi:hypothetical protein K1719_012639 [Acacia pycnantha]|nr:hypothetical protein K1719_012639 [Acacia pycnantha]